MQAVAHTLVVDLLYNGGARLRPVCMFSFLLFVFKEWMKTRMYTVGGRNVVES